MKPSIAFHDIASVYLTETLALPANSERSAFATRMLVLTDSYGEKFRVSLFGADAAGLRLESEAAPMATRDTLADASVSEVSK